MKFALRDHQGKGRPFYQALLDAGHRETRQDETTDLVLMDFDLPHPAYTAWANHARDHGAALVIYPHGFSTTPSWHIVGTPIDQVDLTLVPGQGQADIMGTYGYPHPVQVVGWPGPRRPIHPRPLRRVVFAPHHPLGSGYMQPSAKEANAEAFRLLLSEPFNLTVRHVGTLAQNGLWKVDGVEYIQGAMGGPIQVADLVVAGGTYAANCLSVGSPVVMYDQDCEWCLESETKPEAIYPPGWRDHRASVRFPFDLAPGVCAEAAADPNPPEVQAWVDRFLGPVFDPAGFVAAVEKTVEARTERLAA